MMLVDNLLYGCRNALSSHLARDVCRQILVTCGERLSLQRPVHLRSHSLPVDSQIRRRWLRCWWVLCWLLQILDEPLQIVPGYARLNRNVMQVIFKIPLL